MDKSAKSKYISKKPDLNGIVPYSAEDNEVWSFLIKRQMEVIQNRACPEFKEGLDKLNLAMDKIPQPHEVTNALQKATGWGVQTVEAVIPAEEFFTLLANKKFPAASFIRHKDEIDYLQEPDIFHEIYGHCPLLSNPSYASFVEEYGKMALGASSIERKSVFRIFWFTIEFGLIQTTNGLRIYGGGILSSKEETIYALEKPGLIYKPFDVREALRTPFRIDIIQPLYFVINDLSDLYNIFKLDLKALIQEARGLGDYPPLFEMKTTQKGNLYAN